MYSMLFALAGAAIGAGLNYLSSQEEQRNVVKQREALEGTKISPAERARMIKDLNRKFNANISRDMNSMALTYRGSDASLTKAAAMGASRGEQIGAEGSLKSDITSINRGIQAQIAGISDVNQFNAVATGAIEGGIAGAQIGDLTGSAEDVVTDLGTDVVDDKITSQNLPGTGIEETGLAKTFAGDAIPGGETKTKISGGPRPFNPNLLLDPADAGKNIGSMDLGPIKDPELAPFYPGAGADAIEEAIAPWEIMGIAKAVPGIARLAAQGGKALGRGIGKTAQTIFNPGRVMDDVASGVGRYTDDIIQPMGSNLRGQTSSLLRGQSESIYRGQAMPWNAVKRYVTPEHLRPQSPWTGGSSPWSATQNFTRTTGQKLLPARRVGRPVNRMVSPWLKGLDFRRLQ